LENLVGKYRTNLGLLLGAVGLVLLIACANLANLFAARGAARAREFAIHAAVGATRGQIIRKLLLESFLIAILGGALGFFIAVWLRDALIALGPEGVSRFQQISFDLPVLGFTFLVASLTTIVFGLWPAWQTSHANVQLALKEGSAGIGSNSPLMGGWQTGFYREGVPAPSPSNMPSADLEVITGDYFATFKEPLLRGRTFNERDTKDSPRVIIIDQAMADQFFPGEDPIGKRLAVDAGNDEEGNVMSEIVGVVARMRFHAIDEMAPLPVIYCSMAQAQRTSLGLFVRSNLSTASLNKSIRDTVSAIDPSQPVYDARPMIDRVQETWGSQRLLSFLFSIFAGLALVLATV